VGILIKTQWLSWSGHSGYVGHYTVHNFVGQDTVGKMVRTVGNLVILHSVPWSGYSGFYVRIQWVHMLEYLIRIQLASWSEHSGYLGQGTVGTLVRVQ
jgi:hypothetical protein